MNKPDLVDVIVETYELTGVAARKIVDAIFDRIGEALKVGEEVSIAGFGKFRVTDRKARMGRNPATGEPIQIKASKKVAFRAAKELKESV